MILWIALAMLINPFVKLSLNRSTWHVVDIVLASILFLTVIYDIINDCCHRTKNKENPKNKVPKSSPVNSIPKFNVNIEELAKMTLHGAIGRDALKKAKKI
jgi:uncharacterized membrane protein